MAFCPTPSLFDWSFMSQFSVWVIRRYFCEVNYKTFGSKIILINVFLKPNENGSIFERKAKVGRQSSHHSCVSKKSAMRKPKRIVNKFVSCRRRYLSATRSTLSPNRYMCYRRIFLLLKFFMSEVSKTVDYALWRLGSRMGQRNTRRWSIACARLVFRYSIILWGQ